MTQTLAILKLLGLMYYFAPDDSKKDLDLPYLFYWYGQVVSVQDYKIS